MGMVKILEECREMVIEWGTQVDSYFQEKWDLLKADIRQLDKWIADQKVKEAIDSGLPDGWINGNELPKRKGTYIIQDQHGNISTAPFNMDNGSDGYWNIMYLKIKYWQELPKPHKE